MDSFDLPAALLKADAVAVIQTLASVKEPAIRGALRLKLLHSVLSELRRGAQPPAPTGG